MIAPELRRSLRFNPREGKVRIAEKAAEGDLKVLNVSTSGLCFQCSSSLKRAARLDLAFQASFMGLPLNLKGEVIWCTNGNDAGYNVGIRFIDLKEEQEARIARLPGNVDLKNVHIDPALASHVPPALARRRRLVPFALQEGILHLAMADPNDTAALDALQRTTRLPLKTYHAEEKDVLASVQLLYAGQESGAQSQDNHQAVSFLDDILRNALVLRSSDIHIEPHDTPRIRFRVDGRLISGPTVAKSVYPALVSRIKVLSGLDIAERRESQDGRMTWTGRGFDPVDIRVATIPTVHGEHVTMRLLSGNKGPENLRTLGMLDRDLKIFEEVIANPYGLVLLTGPTGCGKSTTLYAALEAINDPDRHILSVEDPVERRISGISQVQVDQADKVGFASALRSLLRHDPDVIMIGEIRDDLSLDVALKSALTGHLVFSSLHTNDAASAPARLVHMGAPPYLVAATLTLVVAQRLVRKLCPSCKRPGSLNPDHARFLRLEPNLPIKMPGGCMACGGTGYRGRMGLFEFLPPSDSIKEMIVQGASAGRIRKAAREEKWRSLLEDGAAKVREGLTDPGEILRAVAGTVAVEEDVE